MAPLKLVLIETTLILENKKKFGKKDSKAYDSGLGFHVVITLMK